MSDYIEMAQGKLGRVIVVRLRPGADVLLSLEEACREHNITNGVILSAIGSLQSPQFCDVVEMPIKAGYGYGETLHLTGPIELTSASGIICHDDEGTINLHVHIGPVRPPRQRARRPSGRGHEGAADAGCRDRGGRRH